MRPWFEQKAFPITPATTWNQFARLTQATAALPGFSNGFFTRVFHEKRLFYCLDGGFGGRVPIPPKPVEAHEFQQSGGDEKNFLQDDISSCNSTSAAKRTKRQQLVLHTRRFRKVDVGYAPMNFWALWGPSPRMQELAVCHGQDEMQKFLRELMCGSCQGGDRRVPVVELSNDGRGPVVEPVDLSNDGRGPVVEQLSNDGRGPVVELRSYEIDYGAEFDTF